MNELEARVRVLEDKVAAYEQMFRAFADGPGQRLAAIFGVSIPVPE